MLAPYESMTIALMSLAGILLGLAVLLAWWQLRTAEWRRELQIMCGI